MLPVISWLIGKGVGAVFNKGVEMFTQPKNSAPQQPSGGYDFQQHMQHLANETGIRVAAIKPSYATFLPQDKGYEFITTLLKEGDNIEIGMYSNVRFPRGGIPEPVIARLSTFSCPGDGIYLKTISHDDASYVYVPAIGPARGLSPNAFVETTHLMMRSLLLMDYWIVDQGHGSYRF